MKVFEELGAHIVSESETEVVMETPVCDRMLQRYGILHGGMSAYLAETVGSYASIQFVNPETHHIVGVELTSTHLSSVDPGDTIISKATLLKRGNKLHYWRIEQFRKSDGELFNVSQIINYVRAHRAS